MTGGAGQLDRGAEDRIETDVLAAVGAVVRCLSRGSEPEPFGLSSLLDRDLGIDSLGLVEVLDRLHDSLGVVVPDRVVEEAGSVGDLVDAVRAARNRGVVGATTPRQGHHLSRTSQARTAEAAAARPWLPADPDLGEAPAGPGVGEVDTLVDALMWHAAAHPQRCHLRLVGEADTRLPTASGGGGATGQTFGAVSYGELAGEATRVAHNLVRLGVGPGDRVAVMLPTSDLYFPVFAGILMAGAVPVPIYPPSRPAQIEEHLRRQVGILVSAGACLLVTVPEARQVARLVRLQVASLREVVVAAELLQADADRLQADVELPGVVGSRPDDIALLQYTSGSTDDPKGVVLTHRDLLANIQAMGSAAAIDGSDVVVTWLPLYHDMGLIGTWLSSLYFGMAVVVMTPQAFLARPARWLWAIHDHGGTVSAAPNFAYELCTSRVRDVDIEGLDLSTWRIAMNGAEPVSAATLTGFASRFAPYGLRPEAMTPVYGMAEVGLGMAFPPIGRGVLVDRVDRAVLMATGRAVPVGGADRFGADAPLDQCSGAAPIDAAGRAGAPVSAPTQPTVDHVSCGKPLPGYDIRVTDGAGAVRSQRREGEIEVRGPSTTSGYFHNQAASATLYDGEWLRTGDLGYLAEGEIYVTGRHKDIIVKGGANLHPEAIESAVGEVDGVRRGCVAAFGAPDEARGTERLVVVAETKESDPAALDRLRRAIAQNVLDEVGMAVDEVVVCAPGSVSKTSSGKIRRSATRQRYRDGTLAPPRRPVAWQLVRFAGQGVAPAVAKVLHDVADSVFAVWAWACFAVVGSVALVVTVVVPGQRRRRAAVYTLAGVLARMAGISLTVRGIDRLPPESFVAVANHASYLDSFALAAVLPDRVAFVAGEVFATQRLVGMVLRRIGAQFVTRDHTTEVRAQLAGFAKLVEAGTPLVFFPEGGLAATVGLRRFHHGAFVVATDAGVPVVPVAIRGTRRLVAPGSRRLRRGPVTVIVGDPIEPVGSGWQAAVELGNQARRVIAEQCLEPDIAGRPASR